MATKIFDANLNKELSDKLDKAVNIADNIQELIDSAINKALTNYISEEQVVNVLKKYNNNYQLLSNATIFEKNTTLYDHIEAGDLWDKDGGAIKLKAASDIDLLNTKIKQLQTPANNTDAVNKDYVDTMLVNIIKRFVYTQILAVDLNSVNEYIYNEYDNNYWYKFEVEYIGPDNLVKQGNIEIPAGTNLMAPVMNVANDFSATSSATLAFYGTNKTFKILNWNIIPYKLKKITIYRRADIK